MRIEKLQLTNMFENLSSGVIVVNAKYAFFFLIMHITINKLTGTYMCTTGFSGEDSGFNLTAPIAYVESQNTMVCDSRNRSCLQAQLLGIGFIPGVTQCTVQLANVSNFASGDVVVDF